VEHEVDSLDSVRVPVIVPPPPVIVVVPLKQLLQSPPTVVLYAFFSSTVTRPSMLVRVFPSLIMALLRLFSVLLFVVM
jgi:hypothetical protein